jgi:hypothetical protein
MNHEEIRLRGLAFDAWLSAIPADAYKGDCPCGCGKKYRYAEREGEEKHFDVFYKKFVDILPEK